MARRGNKEGSIYHRPDGLWQARVSLPNGQRRSFYGKSQQEAVKKLQAAQRAIADGLPLAPERLTVARWLETWLRDSVAHKVRPRTTHRYDEIVRYHLAPRLGHIRLARLTPADVERMMREGLEVGQSP